MEGLGPGCLRFQGKQTRDAFPDKKTDKVARVPGTGITIHPGETIYTEQPFPKISPGFFKMSPGR